MSLFCSFLRFIEVEGFFYFPKLIFEPEIEIYSSREKAFQLNEDAENDMNKQCPNCRQLNPSEAAFCLNCAASLSPIQAGGGQQANQQWNQPNFGSQPPGQNFAPQTNSGGGASQRAIAALILTVAGLFCCGPLTSIPAAIVGWMEADAIKKGQSPSAGMWMAQVGLWGGIIVTILTSIGGLLFLLLSAASSDPYYY